MDFSPVLEFLKNEIGLNAESIGCYTVEKAILDCMTASGASSVYDYVNRLADSPSELERLVESVVIPETSFFRDKAPFAALKKYLKYLDIKNRTCPVRILSVPCSSGEEPYSIAMTLFDLKLTGNRFLIDAVDVSERHLETARAGIFTPYSFRGGNLDFQKKYFTELDGQYLLKEEVRNAVNFEHANILANNFLQGRKPYDIIYCRNLLIYFDEFNKDKAIKTLSEHLSSEGILFVGHAETAKISQSGYISIDYPKAFAFSRKEYADKINAAIGGLEQDQKSSPQPELHFHPPPEIKHIEVKHTDKDTNLKADKSRKENVSEIYKAAEKKAEEDDLIEKEILMAKMLAAEGAQDKAAAICENLLTNGFESADIYYLLGQAAESAGEPLMAEEYLKKAVYLDPGSYEALILLSVIMDRMGNASKAARFRRRAERVRLRN